MRIIYFGNNRLGYQILKWLKEQDENIIGLVIHPVKNRKYGDEIVSSSGLGQTVIFDGSRLNDIKVIKAIRDLNPQIGISALFGYILKPELLQLFPGGVLNLHPAYLPYNRGAYPNVWSIVEGTPAGVTIHYIDKGVDTGDIIARREVPVEPVDTGETLYLKLETALAGLFQEVWVNIKSGQITKATQEKTAGSYHQVRDVDKIDRIDQGSSYKARDLINILRARTFPPYRGAYLEDENGRRIYLRLQLSYEEELKQRD
jgi:methionyl-tRNA formyltransferase